MSCAQWLSVRAVSNRVLHKYRAFASRVRDEAGPNLVLQLRVFTSRLFNQEILPVDYVRCTTRLFCSQQHQHLLPPLFELLSHPAMAAERSAASFKRPNPRFITLPPPLHDAARPLAPPPPPTSARPAVAAQPPPPPQLLPSARNYVSSAARAIAIGDLYALGCPWGSMLRDIPAQAQAQATLSLSQFVVALNPH
jgi:hypothetical protein